MGKFSIKTITDSKHTLFMLEIHGLLRRSKTFNADFLENS